MDPGPAPLSAFHAAPHVSSRSPSVSARIRDLAGVLDTHDAVGGEHRGVGWCSSMGCCIGGLLLAVRRPHGPPSRSIPRPPALHHSTVAGRLVARNHARSSLAAFRPRPPAPRSRSHGTERTSMGRGPATNMPACAGQRREALGRLENARIGQGGMARCGDPLCVLRPAAASESPPPSMSDCPGPLFLSDLKP